MNILVDGRAFVKIAAGISTFLRCSIMEWALLRPEDTIYLVLPRILDSSVDLSTMPANVKMIEVKNWFLLKFPNMVIMQILVPFLVRKYKVNIFYSPVPFIPFFLPKGIKTLIVVHDVVNVKYRNTMELKNKIASTLTYERAIRIADQIWANSYYTKNEVETYFPQRKCIDIFVGCAVDRHLYRNLGLSEQEKQKVRKQLGVNFPFFLFVGSLEPRKNLEFLLNVMPEVYKQIGFKLVVVGGKGWKSSYINDIVSKDNYPKDVVKFLGYVSNEELVKLYNVAHCFVSSSKNEGFGMPQLESMLCGCPIITSHNSAMIEVARGNSGALTIEGYNQNTWLRAMVDFVKEKRCVNQNDLKKYDWTLIVDKLLVKFDIIGFR